jgi:AcrR family transcriptional regulator
LFATRPFHEVRLDDLAAAAHVSKGTLYVYFDTKESLFQSLIADGFTRLVDALLDVARSAELEEHRTGAAGASSWQRLTQIVRELVGFAGRHPHFFQLMRSGGLGPCAEPPAEVAAKREELTRLVEANLRRGVARGELHMSDPTMVARLIPEMVRAMFLHGTEEQLRNPETVAQILLDLLGHGIRQDDAQANPARSRERP